MNININSTVKKTLFKYFGPAKCALGCTFFYFSLHNTYLKAPSLLYDLMPDETETFQYDDSL